MVYTYQHVLSVTTCVLFNKTTFLFADIDDCEDSPCTNEGTCVDHVGRYECICPQLYAGERCHISTGKLSSRNKPAAYQHSAHKLKPDNFSNTLLEKFSF